LKLSNYINEDGHQVWQESCFASKVRNDTSQAFEAKAQESFKAMPLWSGWMINQKVNYM